MVKMIILLILRTSILIVFASGSAKYSSAKWYTRTSLVIALLPYWFRFAQSLRRAVRSPQQQRIHLLNALKYGLAIIATLFSYFYSFYGVMGLWYTWLCFKLISALDCKVSRANLTSNLTSLFSVAFAWDVFQDWGIFTFTIDNSKFPWITFSTTNRFNTANAIVTIINFFLRIAFVLNFLLFTNAGIYGASFNREMSVWFLSILEIYRRGQWNVLRMENEHLNNVGRFRAFEDIPSDCNFRMGNLKKIN
jgi:hypothetical protein